jgi:hypothetical protein
MLLNDLVEHVRRGDCILFLGSGVHVPPPEDSPYSYPEAQRPPMSSALASLLARDCEFEKVVPHDSVSDLQRVSLCYETTQGLGRKSLIDALIHYLDDGKEPSPVLRMLAALPFKIILTTNYDRLFEKALHGCGKQVETLVYDPTPYSKTQDPIEDPTPDRPLLFKIYGDLTRFESIVITDEDHIGFVQRMSERQATHPVPTTICFRMRTWPMLSLGYSLRDYNLRLLIRTLLWEVDPSAIPQIYSVDPFPDPLILRVWQNSRHMITFLAESLWTFTPWLYREIVGSDFPPDERVRRPDLPEAPK